MSAACRLCGAPLTRTFVDLGSQPVANEYPRNAQEAAREPLHPLHAFVCDRCLLVQVAHDVPRELLFNDEYAYFSSVSTSWVEHARVFAEAMRARFGIGERSLVAEVASNDGYLLQHFVAAGVPVLGIEPAANCAAAAEAIGVRTVSEFFGRDLAEKLSGDIGAADLIVANNVLAHVPDLDDFVAGFAALLAPEGVVSIEHPHLLELIEGVQFDTIYHEHYSYLSLLVDERALARHGLRVFDVEQLPTHGGSLRVLACRDAASHAEGPGLAAARAREATAGLDDVATYDGFDARVARLCDDAVGQLQRWRDDGRRVVAYGAAAKGVTFLNRCGIRADLVPAVADRSPHKQGRLIPGVHIPIVSPESLVEDAPDVVLLLAWNLAAEVVPQLRELLPPSTTYAVAMPEIREIG